MITAFVPTLNNERTIRRVLKSIKAQTVRPKRIIVIDSGSTDGTEQICKEEAVEFYPPSYFGISGRLGLGRARNRILELIDTPYLLSVDSDIVLRRDHIEKVLPMFGRDPMIAGIAGRQIELNRSEMGDRCRAMVDMRDLSRPAECLEPEYRDFLLGSNSIFRTDALYSTGETVCGDRLRPFDDSLMTNYEDVDIGHKLRALGYKLLWEPSIHTYHLQKDDVRSYIDRAYRYRVFKWQMNGAFSDEKLYRKKAEHNINYVRMGFDIICDRCRIYLVYPYILAGFSFFLEDMTRFPKGSETACRIYNSFSACLPHFASETIRQGVLDFCADALKNTPDKVTGQQDEEIYQWFMSLATLDILPPKFPAMNDTKTEKTPAPLRAKAVEASKFRMEYEKTLNTYGDFRVLAANLPQRRGGRFGVNAGSRWPHTYDMTRYSASIPPYIPYPFFLGHLFSLLKESGVSSWIIDGVAEGYTDEEFIYETFGYAPDLIIAETSAPTYESDIRLLTRIKEFLPDTHICLTGPYVNFLKERAMECPAVDTAIDGEYEYSAHDLALALHDNKPADKISGLIRRSGAKTVINPRTEKRYAALPRPERIITPFYNYNDRPVAELLYPSFQTQLSRGCPYGCVFCLWPHSLYNAGYRPAEPETVVQEIERARQIFGIRSFYLDDETFNIDKKHLHRFCGCLEKAEINLPWMAMARADGGLDEELIVRMKKCGLIGLKFGIESVDENVLKEINKKLDIKKCENTLALCRKHGISIHLTFTLGYMSDTPETVEKTFRWMLEQTPDSQQVSVVTPFPGTPMYYALIKSGVLTDDKLCGYDGAAELVFENTMGREETLRLKQQWIDGWNRHVSGKRG